jgi:dolichol-phosphate mannosyltransferase
MLVSQKENSSFQPLLSIIVPTLNEAENIPSLVTQVAAALSGKVPGWDMIIVDDDSADGTDRICERLRRQGLPVSLVVRESEKGLATAVLEGFCRSKGEYLVVMDADLSHPPEKIPEFYRHLRRGSDFVLGSRYLPGGGTDDKWTVYRYLNSKAATFLALPLAHLTDPMSGFFALPRSTWKRCRDLSPVGYKIALELLVKGRPRKITEIPIYFRTRRCGKSKLNFTQQLLYLKHIGRLYRYKMRRTGGK